MSTTGRFAVMDGRHTRVADAGQAGTQKVATFWGGHHHAEHSADGNEMHVFGSYSEMGQPAKKFGEEQGTSGIRSTAGDARPNPRADYGHAEDGGPRTISDLQRMHEKHFARLRGERDDHEVHIHL